MPNPTEPTSTPPPASKPTHHARMTITIDGVDYATRPVRRQDLGLKVVQAFTMTRRDPKLGKVRHLIQDGAEGPACSCGDQTYRQTPAGGECKHISAAKALGLF